MTNLQESPLVSIGFTVYNGADRMRKAIDSLTAQTYRNFELIISDNNSRDDTQKIAEEYAAGDSRIRYVRQTSNIGQVNNLAFVISQSQGRYFLWAADDDWCDPRFLEALAEALEENPHCGVAMCSYKNVYSDGEVKNTVLLTGKYNLTDQPFLKVYEQIVLNKPIHHFLHGLHRTELLRRLFKRPMPSCIRWDRIFMCELALATSFCSVKEVLFFKTVAREPIKARYQNDQVGRAFLDPLAHTRYLFNMLSRPITSAAVPPHRKFFVVKPCLKLAWRMKRAIFQEILRSLAPKRGDV